MKQIMKNLMQWVLAATLICGTSVFCWPMVFRRVGGYLRRLDIRQGLAADGT